MVKIAVLLSGEGSNRKAITDAGIPVSLVLADRVCVGLRSARHSGIAGEMIERTDFTPAFEMRRDEFTLRVLKLLNSYEIGFVVMMGYKTILSPRFFQFFGPGVINGHPSLLPRFPGNRAMEEFFASGETWGGCTLHVATEKVDNGRMLVQARVRRSEVDTLEEFRKRIKRTEHNTYPRAIKNYLQELGLD